jgi:choline dehydrogenase-like flavoprotein
MTVRSLAEDGFGPVSIDARVCVVGAGIAGLLLGLRLARKGHRVVVLESGGRVPEAGIDDLNRLEEAVPRYQMALSGRARGLGGSSSRWGGRMLPLAAHDFAARPYLSLAGWPIGPAELDPYRAEIEALFGVDPESYEEELLGRVDRAGLFPRRDPEFAPRWPKWSSFRRCNLAILLKRELESNASLEIWLAATAAGFELEPSGRLRAILARDLRGRRLRAAAEEFVLAAGTIETTRLLLWLRDSTGGQVLSGCEALGRGFQDHLSTVVGRLRPERTDTTNRLFGFHFIGQTRRNLHLELTASAQAEHRVASGFAQIAIEPPANSALDIVKNLLRGLQQKRIDLSARDVGRLAANGGVLGRMATWRYARKQLFLPPGTDLLVSLVAEQLPKAGNAITLSARKDAVGVPVARLDWTTSDGDERTFRVLAGSVDRYWRRARFDRICPIAWRPGVLEGEVALAAEASDIAHPSGSARMGTDRAASVVDPELRCHDVPNLTVASAAVFPSAGSANPTFTIMQLALRGADAISRRLH